MLIHAGVRGIYGSIYFRSVLNSVVIYIKELVLEFIPRNKL